VFPYIQIKNRYKRRPRLAALPQPQCPTALCRGLATGLWCLGPPCTHWLPLLGGRD